MKKVLLTAALAASMCVPAYANYATNGDAVYDAPEFDRDVNEVQVVE